MEKNDRKINFFDIFFNFFGKAKNGTLIGGQAHIRYAHMLRTGCAPDVQRMRTGCVENCKNMIFSQNRRARRGIAQ